MRKLKIASLACMCIFSVGALHADVYTCPDFTKVRGSIKDCTYMKGDPVCKISSDQDIWNHVYPYLFPLKMPTSQDELNSLLGAQKFVDSFVSPSPGKPGFSRPGCYYQDSDTRAARFDMEFDGKCATDGKGNVICPVISKVKKNRK